MSFPLLFSLFYLFSEQLPRSVDQEPSPSFADSLTVYVFLHDECVISQFFTPELTRLYEKYKSHRVGFVGYFPNASSTTERIKTFGKDYQLSFPLLEDYKKAQTRRFGITVTPEVAIWDHRTGWQIYRGRIDDSYVRVGKRKTHPQNHDVEAMIESWIQNENQRLIVKTQAIGCFINFTDD